MKPCLFLFVLVSCVQMAFSQSAEVVFDLNRGVGPIRATPENLTALGSVLYFTADDGIRGRELWKSDGTSAGTVLVADLLPGPRSSNPHNFVELNGTIYFAANADGTTSLYRIGAGQQKPERLAEFSNADIGEIQIVSNRLFVALGHGLWTIENGIPRVVEELNSRPTYLTASSGLLFFSLYSELHGSELWRSDGTEPGTFMVRDIAPGPQHSFPIR